MGGYLSSAEPEIPPVEARVSNIKSEDLLMCRLNYFMAVLEENRAKYAKQSKQELSKALKVKGDKPKALFHLQKRQLCKEMMTGIDQKILLIQKQLNIINTQKEDLQLSEVLKDSNRLIDRLNREIDVNVFAEAINLVEDSESTQLQLTEIMEKVGI